MERRGRLLHILCHALLLRRNCEQWGSAPGHLTTAVEHFLVRNNRDGCTQSCMWNTKECMVYIIILILHKFCLSVPILLSVRTREVTRSHSTRAKLFLFLCKATARSYIKKSRDTASKGASSRLKEMLLQSVEQK